MTPIRNTVSVLLVTVLVSPCLVWCTHFNASSAVHWLPERQLENSPGAGAPVTRNSFSSDSINVNLDGSSSASSVPSTFSITPSVSYQFHTNDHEHLDKIVLAHHNSVRNSFSSSGAPVPASDSEVGASSSVGRVEKVGDDEGNNINRLSNFPSSAAGVSANNNPALGLSSYQQEQGSVVAATKDAQHIRGDWQGKQQQQQQQPIWQYHQPGGPQAIPDRSSLQPQRKVQDGKAQEDGNNGNAHRNKLTSHNNPYQSASNSTQQHHPPPPPQRQQPQQRKPIPNVQYQARKDTPIASPPPSIIYSRPLKNGAPTTYQWQNKHVQPKLRSVAPAWKSSPASKPASRFGGPVAGNQSPPGTRLVPPPASPPMKIKPAGKKRKILTSRADSYANQEEEDEEEMEDDNADNLLHYHNDYRYGMYDNVKEATEDQGGDDTDQGDEEDDGNFLSEDGTFPEIRDLGFHGDGGFPGGPGGPPGPLPPPPPPIKGTVDYILIPLILIGLAGPIFVVLYVILGGFEYKLAPIARSLKSQTADYQPYIDSLTSSVGRALETYDCYEYASCRVRRAYNRLGLSSTTGSTIETALTAVTPKEYLPTLTKAFSSLNDSRGTENCVKYQCSDMVEYFL